MNYRAALSAKRALEFLPVARASLQRKCACGQHTVAGGEVPECKKKREQLQRQAVAGPGPIGAVPQVVHDVLRSPGRPLEAGTRAFMEPRFGFDFSRVRIHTDARAAESARAVDAHAYTVGDNVVFGPGQYRPETHEGRRLLAHELTHTLQQAGGEARRLDRLGDLEPDVGPAEDEAERTAGLILAKGGKKKPPAKAKPQETRQAPEPVHA